MEQMAVEPKSLAELGLESYQMVTLHRSDLKDAEYNPRVINDVERRKLKAGLKRHGLVAPITFNIRTGKICGGHQRIHQLDSLAGTHDYTLQVAQIDVDENREKEINILLNNQNAAGDWDLEALGALVKDPLLDLTGTGFDHADLFRLFGDTPILARDEDLDELAQKVRDARDKYDKIEKNNKGGDDSEFYCVLVFRDAAQLSKFIAAAKLPDNRYQSGEDIATLCGLLEKIA